MSVHRNSYNLGSLRLKWQLSCCEFLEYWNTQKKCLEDLTFFMSTWWGDSKNVEEIEFSRWPFDGRLRQGKNVLPDGLNWLCCFAGDSKGHCKNSISFIFLKLPHQVDMKNVVKSVKHFFGYFNTLETHSVVNGRQGDPQTNVSFPLVASFCIV